MTDKNTDMNNKIYAMALTVLLIMGCNNDSDLTIKDPVEGFSVSQNEIEIYPAGGTAEIMLTSADDWSATYPDWISINGKYDDLSGEAGSIVLQIKADVNKTQELRNGYIDINSDDQNLIIEVSQDYPMFTLSIDGKQADRYPTPDPFEWHAPVHNESKPMELNIKCNTWWKIQKKDGASYFEFSQESGEGNGILKITPREINISKNIRTANFTLEGPVYSYSITLNQENRTFMLNKESVSVNELGKVISGISLDSEFNWNTNDNIPTDQWSLNTKSGNGYYGNPIPTDLKLTVKPNNTRDTLHHEIIFTPESDELSFNTTLKVKQDPFIFDIEGNNKVYKKINNNPETGDALELKLNSSADWEIDVKTIPDWLNISKKSGTGAAGGKESTLTLYAKDQNLDFENNSRKNQIKLQNKANDLEIEMEVEQDMYVLSVENDNYILKTIPNQETNTDNDGFITVPIETSGAWEVTTKYPSNDEWLVFSSKTGRANDDLKLKAKEINTLNTDRTCTVTITSTLHKQNNRNLSRTITVIQNKAIFESVDSGNTYSFAALPAENEHQTITYDSSFDIEIVNDPWIEIIDHNTNDKSIKFSVTDNIDPSPRSGTISISPVIENSAELPTINPIIFNVEQEKYEFDVNDSSCQNAISNTGADLNIYINCSGQWECTGNDQYDWLSVSMPSDRELRVTVNKNEEKGERTATITIRSKDNPDLYKDIKITQKGK